MKTCGDIGAAVWKATRVVGFEHGRSGAATLFCNWNLLILGFET